MGRGFGVYLLTCIITLVFGIAFSNPFILFLLAIFIVAPFASKLLMAVDAKHMNITIGTKSECMQFGDINFDVNFSTKRRLLAQGLLYLTFEITYLKYNEVRIKRIKCPISQNRGVIRIPASPDLCSCVTIKCVSAESEDMLGITKTVLPLPKPFSVTVFPKPLSVNLIGYSQSLTDDDSEYTKITKKGSDYTDVQEFKEYTPGDSVKAIHWKLSSKLDKLITKVGTDNTNYKTLIFFNLGQSKLYGDEKLRNKILSACYQLGFTISDALLRGGLGHKICYTGEFGVGFYSVSDYDTSIIAQREILVSPLPADNKSGSKYLLSDMQVNDFSKILCICTEDNTNDVDKLAFYADVTTFVISPNVAEARATQNTSGKLYELPFDGIFENQYNIEI